MAPVVAHGDAPAVLGSPEHPLDFLTPLAFSPSRGIGSFPLSFDGMCASTIFLKLPANLVGVATLVRERRLRACRHPVDQVRGRGAIVRVSGGRQDACRPSISDKPSRSCRSWSFRSRVSGLRTIRRLSRPEPLRPSGWRRLCGTCGERNRSSRFRPSRRRALPEIDRMPRHSGGGRIACTAHSGSRIRAEPDPGECRFCARNDSAEDKTGVAPSDCLPVSADATS